MSIRPLVITHKRVVHGEGAACACIPEETAAPEFNVRVGVMAVLNRQGLKGGMVSQGRVKVRVKGKDPVNAKRGAGARLNNRILRIGIRIAVGPNNSHVGIANIQAASKGVPFSPARNGQRIGARRDMDRHGPGGAVSLDDRATQAALAPGAVCRR